MLVQIKIELYKDETAMEPEHEIFYVKIDTFKQTPNYFYIVAEDKLLIVLINTDIKEQKDFLEYLVHKIDAYSPQKNDIIQMDLTDLFCSLDLTSQNPKYKFNYDSFKEEFAAAKKREIELKALEDGY